MKHISNEIKVESAINKFKNKIWKNELSFQRKDDAWKKKQKALLVKSVLENYYIPPILLTNSNILDGLQRLTALTEFYEGKLKINWYDEKNIDWDRLSSVDKEKFLSYKLIVVDIKNDDGSDLSSESQEELFIRINENSIKLSTSEKIMAKANPIKRNFVRNIAETPNLKNLSNKKISDKRFSHSMLIARCLTIIWKNENPDFGTTDIRKSIPKYMAIENNPQFLAEVSKKSIRIINAMWEIFGDDGIPPKYFNVVFESIFVVFYQNFESLNSFLQNKVSIKSRVQHEILRKLLSNQMGGGTKFDGYKYVNQRANMVFDVVKQYRIDPKRSFSSEERYLLWLSAKEKSSDHKVYCEECGKEIVSYKDFDVDHNLAHTKGGPTVLSNARILHKHCNRSKGAR